MKEPTRKDYRVSPKRSPDPVRQLRAEDLLPQETISATNEPAVQELSVKGLLSFGEQTSFVFGRLNILVGPNGSGKSNLIDCVRVLRNAPLDIQDAFKDSGFEEWLHKGSDE